MARMARNHRFFGFLLKIGKNGVRTLKLAGLFSILVKKVIKMAKNRVSVAKRVPHPGTFFWLASKHQAGRVPRVSILTNLLNLAKQTPAGRHGSLQGKQRNVLIFGTKISIFL